MQGKICLVTGATDGIGKITVRVLAQQGATVIGVGRNPAKIEAMLAELGATPGPVEFLTADLSSHAAIRTLAEEFHAKYDKLHILINNAGAMFQTYSETVDGIEMTFGLNHLGYFLLTHLLLDTIKTSAPARIINVSSGAHTRATSINFDDLGYQHSYDGWMTYSQSKLANILFTRELARRLDGTRVTVNACHPGFVDTNFQNAAGLNMRGQLTPEEGADTQNWLAMSDEVEGITGKYFERRRDTQPTHAARDDMAARRLWEVSAELVGTAPD